MIPVSLRLRNFMSYVDMPQPLRFDGIHVAVLCGENGQGKSALLDALTWALWGKCRARSVDDLIHAGAAEMEVEFEFLLEEQSYRVIRKRQRRGRVGNSVLELAVLSTNGYRPLTERSVAETERAIERILKMSYETFTSSSFIQQGRADTFTTNQPAERKKILAEILDLGVFDGYEQRARDGLREREFQLHSERARVREWDAEIARKPALVIEAERLAGELAGLDEQLASAEQAHSRLLERVTQLEAAKRQVDAANARLVRLSEESGQAQLSLAKQHKVLAEAEPVVARAPEIEAAVAELTDARRALGEADRKQEQFLPLEHERQAANTDLAAETARLETDIANRARLVAEQRKLAARLPELERQLRSEIAAMELLQQCQSAYRECEGRCSSLREQIAVKRSDNTHLKDAMSELRGRMEAVASMETCPSCQRPMDEKHRAALLADYRQQGLALKTQFRVQERLYLELDGELQRQQEVLRSLAPQVEGMPAAQRRLAQAESAINVATDAQAALAVQEIELARLQVILAAGDFAQPARAALLAIERQQRELAYSDDEHRRLRRRCEQLAGADAEQQRLAQARHQSTEAREHVGLLSATIERLKTDSAAEQANRDELAREAAAYPEQQALLLQLERNLVQCKRQREIVRDQHVQLAGTISYCEFLERNRAESLIRQDAVIREQGIFSELVTAFGKRGVQAMIIETVLPEMEEEANRLLGRMTQGRMSVKLETQRDTRSGSGTIETLDIRIADELGTRNYEMFSGGEAFRVNFALRVALSKLLATRAGAKLQLLVIDEGFGSQDADGRERIVEAIQAIQDEFRKILVVTHLEDLRDRFPERIEVTKTASGSAVLLR